MKIIQLLQKPQLRGAEIFACQLSNHLIQQGNEVLVVTIFSGDTELPFNGEIIKLDRPLTKRFYDINGWKSFSSIIEEFKPNIIQANAADTLKFAVSSKLLFKWDSKIIFRNANKMGDFITSQMKWYLNKFYLNRVDFVISVSKECEIDFKKTFKFPREKIQTIEIGVENAEIGELSLDLKRIYNRGEVIVHIGGFVTEKNHEGVVEIFSQILKDFPNAQLLLIGKGRLEEHISEKVFDLNIQENVHFLGYRKDILCILANANAFILPSFIEGLPGVILEAMFCETPVIANDVGGVREVVINNYTGWLREVNDQNGFVKDLKYCLGKDQTVVDNVSNAKKMIHDKFLNSIISQRFFEVYSKLN